jgi:hypothetical protein
VQNLDPLLHGTLQHAAATVWDTLQQAETHELLSLHNYLKSWSQTPLMPAHIPLLLHTILASLRRHEGSPLGGHLPFNAISPNLGPHPVSLKRVYC